MNVLLLSWATLAIPLFNAILLLWLGATVLLNSDKRTVGIWAASAGLLLGSTFFFAHTVIIARGVVHFGWLSMLFWWTIAMVPAIILPYAWYVIMLWYSGFWTREDSPLRRRQRRWLLIISVGLGIGLLSFFAGLVLLMGASPQLSGLRRFMRWSIAGIPLLAGAYSLYVVLCIGLSLDAVGRPGPARRAMGNIARQRARPWLVAASLALLLVSFVVMGAVLWLVQDVQRRTFLRYFSGAIHPPLLY
jgi:hypothetical protein